VCACPQFWRTHTFVTDTLPFSTLVMDTCGVCNGFNKDVGCDVRAQGTAASLLFGSNQPHTACFFRLTGRVFQRRHSRRLRRVLQSQ
jgi:hypothetical protein